MLLAHSIKAYKTLYRHPQYFAALQYWTARMMASRRSFLFSCSTAELYRSNMRERGGGREGRGGGRLLHFRSHEPGN